MSRARRGLAAVALAAVVPAGLAACTAVGPGPDVSAPTTPADLLPGGEPAATDGPRPTATDVVVSYAGWDEATGTVQVGGYVSPVVEAGGTCTAVLEAGARTVTVEGPGLPDATTTVCGDLAVAGGDLAAGEWSVVLRYESGTTEGSSEAVSVEIPR